MDFVFIKAGGSGNIIKNDKINIKHKWLFYRQINIDADFYNILIDEICHLTINKKVGFMLGGVGVFLYIDFAKKLEIKSEGVHKVGSDIINIASAILLNVFLQKKIKVYPKLVDPDSNFKKLYRCYDLVLFQANEKYYSTDSIVACAAAKFINSKLILFKTNLASRIKNYDSSPSVSSLKSIAINTQRIPGESSLIDLQALEIIENNNIKTIICEKELIKKTFNN
ncbi:MAG: hypothetical protein DWQ05_12845 [Calditrichaeota bacterium]|nr:MAG: hypothetical protein DWQ05_12845 [Calditrichota bacterium]